MGTTDAVEDLEAANEDHPHIRGDHAFNTDHVSSSLGSPPHTWGPLLIILAVMGSIRITPTYVGTTDSGRRGE